MINLKMFSKKVVKKYYIVDSDVYEKYVNSNNVIDFVNKTDDFPSYNSWEEAEAAAHKLGSEYDWNSDKIYNIIEITKIVSNESFYYLIFLLLIFVCLLSYVLFFNT